MCGLAVRRPRPLPAHPPGGAGPARGGGLRQRPRLRARLPHAGKPRSIACPLVARRPPGAVEAGLVWVWPDLSPEGVEAAKSAAPPVPADVAAAAADGAPEGDGPRVMCTSGGWLTRDLPYSFDAAIENVLDPAHALFAHHGYLGKRGDAIPFSVKLKGETTLEGGLALDLGSHSAALAAEDRVLEFQPPCFSKNVLTVKGGMMVAVCGYFVPSRPGWTRMISMSWASDMGLLARRVLGWVPTPVLHSYTNAVFDGDLMLIHKQEANLERAGGDWSRSFFMPTPSDGGVVAFRRWWDAAGGAAGLPWQGAAAKAAGAGGQPDGATTDDPRALLDRLSQHTAHCASCRAALRRLERAESAGGAAAAALALAAAGGLGPAAPLVGAAALAVLVAAGSRRLKQELIYRPYEHH
eukprot:scaffold40.g5169.t1